MTSLSFSGAPVPVTSVPGVVSKLPTGKVPLVSGAIFLKLFGIPSIRAFIKQEIARWHPLIKELNIRLGTTATIIQEFRAVNSYFGAEYGNSPVQTVVTPGRLRTGLHGTIYETHQNSITSARSCRRNTSDRGCAGEEDRGR